MDEGAYISKICLPDVLFQLSKCARIQDPQKEDTKHLKDALKQLNENKLYGLQYQKLDNQSIKIMAIDDASFEPNRNKTS